MVIFWTASGWHTNPLYHARSDSPQSFGNVFGIPALGISGRRPHLTASNTWTQPVQPNVPTPLSRFGQWASSLSSSLPLMLGLILMVQHIQSGYVFQAAGAWRGGMSIFNPDQTCLTRDVKPAHWYCMGLLIKDNSGAVCIGHMERLSVSQTGTLDWSFLELKLCQEHSVYFNHTLSSFLSFQHACLWLFQKRLLFL